MENLTEKINEEEFRTIADARSFFYTTLKQYKLYKENEELYSKCYSCCDKCYSILPKWHKTKFYHNDNKICFCSDCHLESLTEEEKKNFSLVEYEKINGLYY